MLHVVVSSASPNGVLVTERRCVSARVGRGGCWFRNPKPVIPKPVMECWEKMRFGGVCSPPYHSLTRFLGTLTKVKAEHLFISWDIAQVKLKVSLLSLLQWLKWCWLFIKTTFHYYSSS